MMRSASAALAVVALALALGQSGASAQSPGSAQAVESKGKIFVCGEDEQIPPIPMRWSTIVLAGDGRLYMPCPGNALELGPANPHGPSHREVREGKLIGDARLSRELEHIWRATQALSRVGRDIGAVIRTARVVPMCSGEVQIFGGLGDPKRWQPGELFRLVRSPYVRVQREAAYGIGLALSRPGVDSDVATAARKEIEACILAARDATVEALLLEAMGVTRYGKVEDRQAAEQYLSRRTQRGVIDVTLGAVKGLEALIRQDPQRPVSDETRSQLRQLVVRDPPGLKPTEFDKAARVRRLAMMALQAARDEDLFTLDRAADDRDWQVRRLAAMRLNLADEAQARIGDRLAVDQVFQVKYEYLGALSRQATRTRLCAPLVPYFEDVEQKIVMRAMDLMNAKCTDLKEGLPKLIAEADRLAKPETNETWHVPTRAFNALVRVQPEEAKSRLEAIVKHEVWQVRAAAAAASVTLGEADHAVALASDPIPNVQTAAIDALARAKHSETTARAVEILKHSADFQLLRAAARALAIVPVPEESRDDVTEVLLAAMRRLTLLEEDPSRDPRVAILTALGGIMRKERSTDLLAFTDDFDDEVNDAAAEAFRKLIGAPVDLVVPTTGKKRRYPFQPTELALGQLPKGAILILEQGSVVIDLTPGHEVAPVTIARFAALVNAGYYNGLTFHRVEPNFVVQGGSPGANEYAGTVRYMRDEVGNPHLRGAVGISTRGPDTGDAQIFIDLVDLPRLDRDYTVFGYVRSGMEIIDRLLEGAVINSIILTNVVPAGPK